MSARRPLVVILTAGMGAGHDQVGRELGARLDRRGVAAKLVDTSELLPPGWGSGLTGLYKFMACRAQWLYELTFRAQMSSRADTSASLLPLAWPASRRLARLVERDKPRLLLSTFHLCSQVAGRMRASGELEVPVASYVLDFFVHGMWSHSAVDAHLLLHPAQAPQLLAMGGRNPVVCGPVVRPAFRGMPRWARDAARGSLGLGPADRVVLVVAGSWGVGAVEQTVEAVSCAGRFLPVVVAGRNEPLRRSLVEGSKRRTGARVFGWVDDMDRLVASADVVVENAGGLTAMEAMARGVPVVSYAPIAGHGRANAREMERAGVSVYAHDARQLAEYLDEVTQASALRRRLVAQAGEMFSREPADFVAQWAREGEVVPPASSGPRCIDVDAAGAPSHEGTELSGLVPVSGR